MLFFCIKRDRRNERRSSWSKQTHIPSVRKFLAKIYNEKYIFNKSSSRGVIFVCKQLSNDYVKEQIYVFYSSCDATIGNRSSFLLIIANVI
jgi:hypothetical protein